MHPYFRLNDDERDAFDHDGLISFAHDEELTSRQAHSILDAHNRIYGDTATCPYCMKDLLRRAERSYERPAAEPVRSKA